MLTPPGLLLDGDLSGWTAYVHLNRRAIDRPKRTKDTAIARERAQQCFTAAALVVEVARVSGHDFLFDISATGAREY